MLGVNLLVSMMTLEERQSEGNERWGMKWGEQDGGRDRNKIPEGFRKMRGLSDMHFGLTPDSVTQFYHEGNHQRGGIIAGKASFVSKSNHQK